MGKSHASTRSRPTFASVGSSLSSTSQRHPFGWALWRDYTGDIERPMMGSISRLVETLGRVDSERVLERATGSLAAQWGSGSWYTRAAFS